jgi:WD40 repeat protein/pimeloyl-ACP methyl ester carboxylesterase
MANACEDSMIKERKYQHENTHACYAKTGASGLVLVRGSGNVPRRLFVVSGLCLARKLLCRMQPPSQNRCWLSSRLDAYRSIRLQIPPLNMAAAIWLILLSLPSIPHLTFEWYVPVRSQSTQHSIVALTHLMQFSRPFSQRSKSSTNSLEEALRRLSISTQQTDIDAPADVVGRLGLTLLFQPSEPLIDFIFVHGLGGGSRKTWAFSKEPLHYWPQQWLPRDPSFKNVRIHTFGYASKWAEIKSSALNVHDFAKSLVAAIQDSPHMGIGQRTPIVLIGHSMGGLVIKKAYMIAREDPLYNALGERFHTMIFLATPHRGSGLARVLDYSLKSVLMPYGSKAYVDDLKGGSIMLQLINDGFRHVSGNLQLRSFYEVVETQIGPASSLIVSRESAVLGYPNEHNALINANHRGICKFHSPSDANYLILRNALASITKDILSDIYHQKREEQQKQLRLLERYLGVQEISEDDLAAYEERQIEGSCEWLTSSKTFCDWRDGHAPSNAVFWVNGQPGSGKSFIATHVVKSLEDLNMDTSYFFIRHGDKSCSNLESCLRSLAFQMALMNFNVREEILAMQENEIRLDRDEPRALWRKLFVSGIFRATFQRTQYWVIDGLDECYNPSALFPLLANLDSRVPLRICITSRTTPPIQKGFSQLQNVTMETASQENTLGDIKLYVKNKIDELHIDRIEYRHKITSTIIEKSEGCFLWVVLVLEELENAFSESDIDLILKEVPVGMDPLYERILEGMSQASRGKQLAKAILMWSTCATRALTIEELEAALRIQTKDEGIFALEKFISSTCGNLAYVDRYRKVRMIHQTAKEFLLRDDLNSEFAIRGRDTHSELADTCLHYLICDEMKAPRNRKLITPTEQRVKKRSPFADYACTSFSDHLRRADTANDSYMVLLDKFFRSNVLSWIEAVAAKGTLSALILTAKNLRGFLESREKNRGPIGTQFQLAANWSTDLRRIAAKFGRNLSESPTAIYWLIPPFCPLESSIKVQFGSSHVGVSVTGLSNTVWNDRLACKTYGSEQASSTACSDKHFAVGLSSGTIHLYFQDTCQEARVLKHSGRRDPAKFMAFDTSGGLLLCAGVRAIRLWNTANGAQVWSSTLSVPPVAILFSDGDTMVVSISNQNAITTRDVSTGKIISSTTRHNPFETQQLGFRRPIDCAAISPEHNLVSVVYRGLPIAIYTMDDNEFLGSCAREEGAREGRGDIALLSMIFNPNPELNLIAALYLDGDLALYDTVELELVELVNGADAKSLAASPAGRTLATGDAGGVIQIYDFETLRLLYRIVAADQPIRSMSFSTDGMRLLDVRGTHSNVWEPSVLVRANATESESVSDTYPVNPKTVGSRELYEKGDITAVAPHPTENVIFGGIDDGSVFIYDSTTGGQIKILCRHKVSVSISHIAFGNKSNILVTADTSARVLMWKISKNDGKLQCDEPYLDHRFPATISQLLLNSTEDQLLVCMGEQCTLWNFAENKSPNGSTVPVAEARIWSNDVDNPTELIAISRSSPHRLSRHLWADLGKVSSTDISDLGMDDVLQNVFTGMKNKVILESSTVTAKQSRRVVILDSVSSPSKPTNSTPTMQMLLPSEIRCIISVYLTKLLFLDKSAWICSIDLSEKTTPGRRGARAAAKADTGVNKQITRHFFIPDDWLSTNSEIMFQVLPNSNFFFVNGHEMAIISKAL